MSKELSEFLEKNQFKLISDTLDTGDSVLHVAVRGKRLDILEEIIYLLRNVNQVNYLGQTPLQIATSLEDNDRIIEILLKYQAKIYLPREVFQEISKLKLQDVLSKDEKEKRFYDEFNSKIISTRREMTALDFSKRRQVRSLLDEFIHISAAQGEAANLLLENFVKKMQEIIDARPDDWSGESWKLLNKIIEEHLPICGGYFAAFEIAKVCKSFLTNADINGPIFEGNHFHHLLFLHLRRNRSNLGEHHLKIKELQKNYKKSIKKQFENGLLLMLGF